MRALMFPCSRTQTHVKCAFRNNVSLRCVAWQDAVMGDAADLVGRMGPDLELLQRLLDEKSRRLVLGMLARAAGDGGGAAVAGLAGASWQTVADGAAELASGQGAAAGRVARPGGGRKRLAGTHPQVVPALPAL